MCLGSNAVFRKPSPMVHVGSEGTWVDETSVDLPDVAYGGVNYVLHHVCECALCRENRVGPEFVSDRVLRTSYGLEVSYGVEAGSSWSNWLAGEAGAVSAIVDSGCSATLVPRGAAEALGAQFYDLGSPVNMLTPNGAMECRTGVTMLVEAVNDDGKSVPLRICGLLGCDDGPFLLAGSALDKSVLEFDGDSWVMVAGHMFPVQYGSSMGGVAVPTWTLRRAAAPSMVVLAAVQKDTLLRWHRAMGHMTPVNMRSWLDMLKITYVASEVDALRACDVCNQCRGVVHHPGEAEDKGNYFNDVVSVDLMFLPGFLSPVVFMQDDFSRYVQVEVAKCKEDSVIAKAIERCWFGTEGMPNKLFSDNGGEFVDVKGISRHLGVVVMETAPESPWSIARNDRAHRTAKEMLCRVYTDAGGPAGSLPEIVWPEVLKHVAWVMNNTPHSALDGRTPSEVAKGLAACPMPRWIPGERVRVFTGRRPFEGGWKDAVFLRRVHSGEVRVWMGGKVKRVPPCRVKDFSPIAESGHGGGQAVTGVSAPAPEGASMRDLGLSGEGLRRALAELRDSPDVSAVDVTVPVPGDGGAVSTMGEVPELDEWDWKPMAASAVCVVRQCPAVKHWLKANKCSFVGTTVEEQKVYVAIMPAREGAAVGSVGCPPVEGQHAVPTTDAGCPAVDKKMSTIRAALSAAGLSGGDVERTMHSVKREMTSYPTELAAAAARRKVPVAKPSPPGAPTCPAVKRAHVAEAKSEELNGMLLKGVYEPVPYEVAMEEVRAGRAQLITSKWVMTEKVDMEGLYAKTKARNVVRGFQDRRFDNDEGRLAAPTPRWDSLRCLMAVAAQRGDALSESDVKQAFLNADFDNSRGDIYIRPLDGSIGVLWKVIKNAYGLRDAPVQWFTLLQSELRKLGWEPIMQDPCVVVKRDVRGRIVDMMIAFVDDILGAGMSCLADMKALPFQFGKGPSDIVDAFKFGGYQITKVQDGDGWSWKMHQAHYCEAMRESISPERWASLERRPATSAFPLGRKLKLDSAMCSEAQHEEFRSMLGKLQWVGGGTRPDLSVAISILSRHVQSPTEEMLDLVYRAVHYAYLKRNRGLLFPILSGNVDARLYCDATWAGMLDESTCMRSQSGYVLVLRSADGRQVPISWRSRVQRKVARSSAASELLAIEEGLSHSAYLMDLLRALGVNGEEGISLTTVTDSASAMKMLDRRTLPTDKSVLVALQVVREFVADGVVMEFIPGVNNPADDMTKPTLGEKISRMLLPRAEWGMASVQYTDEWCIPETMRAALRPVLDWDMWATASTSVTGGRFGSQLPDGGGRGALSNPPYSLLLECFEGVYQAAMSGNVVVQVLRTAHSERFCNAMRETELVVEHVWTGRVHYVSPVRKSSDRGCPFKTTVSVIYGPGGDDAGNRVLRQLRAALGGVESFGAPWPGSRFEISGVSTESDGDGTTRVVATHAADGSLRAAVPRLPPASRAYYERSMLWNSAQGPALGRVRFGESLESDVESDAEY